jgi:hypothetical protein
MLQKHVEGFGGETIDLSKPSPKALAVILRDISLWPADFGKWDFGQCSHCGLKVAQRTWEPEKTTIPTILGIARLLGIAEDTAVHIFIARGGRKFTPEAIAADLDAL